MNVALIELPQLDDIRQTREIAAVYLRGEEVDRDALRTQWRRPPGADPVEAVRSQ